MIKLTDEHREQLTRIADAGRAYDYTDETPAAGLARILLEASEPVIDSPITDAAIEAAVAKVPETPHRTPRNAVTYLAQVEAPERPNPFAVNEAPAWVVAFCESFGATLTTSGGGILDNPKVRAVITRGNPEEARAILHRHVGATFEVIVEQASAEPSTMDRLDVARDRLASAGAEAITAAAEHGRALGAEEGRASPLTSEEAWAWWSREARTGRLSRPIDDVAVDLMVRVSKGERPKAST